MNRKMFEAHVAFELAQWQESLAEEVPATFEWLQTVPTGEVLTAEVVLGWIDA